MIDVATRFPRTTLTEAYERSQRSERWVFPETISSSVTMIYGRSNVGKSFLVSSMLLSLMIEGREFLGMQPTDNSKLWKPAILWTDPGSDEEYAERICTDIPEGVADLEVPMFHVGRTTRHDEWEALTDHLIGEGHNFVVLDNLMGITGDTNDANAVTTVFDGLTRLTRHGVPMVVLHHESEHGGSNPGAAPMGASVAVQKSRVWIQVRQTAKRGIRGGNTALIIQGNGLSQPQQVVAEPMAGPNYRLISRGPWVEPAASTNPNKPKQNRSTQTLDRNADAAAYLVAECQGVGVNQAAKALHAKFPDKAETTWKDQIRSGGVSALVTRTGSGDETVWALAS